MAQGNKLTLSSVQALSPGTILWDGQAKGFGAQGNANGSVSFVVKTRVNGRQRWVTIGKLGSPWTVDTARKEALRILTEAAAGRDAGAEKLERRSKGTFFEDVAVQFMAVHVPKLKPRTREAYGTLIRLHLNPAFGKTPIGDISRAAVASFHAKHADTPRNANHALAVLSKIMSWAEDQGLRPIDSNPCRRISKYREAKRERYLTPDELMRLGNVLAKAEEQHADPYVLAAIRLLLFTGARLSEILTLRWAYIDTHRRVLKLPDSKSGAKAIPLNQPALDVLDALPRLHGNPFVLVGRVEGHSQGGGAGRCPHPRPPAFLCQRQRRSWRHPPPRLAVWFDRTFRGEDVQLGLALLLALLVEAGSGLGLYLVTTPWREALPAQPTEPLMPEVVRVRPAERLGEVDAFMLARLHPAKDNVLTASILYENYLGWCQEEHLVALNLSAFITAFQSVADELGIDRGSVAKETAWRNVSLTPVVALLERAL